MRYSFLIIFLVQFFTGSEIITSAQSTDYRSLFGKDWEKAEAFVSENQSWMKRLSDDYDVSYNEAVAIVFPELIRYSALRDKMEITLLKTLYTYRGEEYANFSVGHFQMKPSFAESIHENLSSLRGRLRNQIREKAVKDDLVAYRGKIVKDLEQPESQFLYLAAFIKICENVFGLQKYDKLQRIKFLSTAYNFGFRGSKEEINSRIDKKFFYTKLVKTETYSYSDISAYWYTLAK